MFLTLQDTNSVKANNLYCENGIDMTGCLGSAGFGNMYNGMRCPTSVPGDDVGQAFCGLCQGGALVDTGTGTASCDNSAIGFGCVGECSDNPNQFATSYPNGHECVLKGQSELYRCDGPSRTFVLVPPAVTPAPTPQPAPQPEPIPEPEPVEIVIEKIQFNIESEVFLQEGSTTTDLSSLTVEEAQSYVGFTVDVIGAGSIEFTEAVDLTDTSIEDNIDSIDNYISINRGIVSLDSATISALAGKAATITMRNVILNPEDITIYRDGQIDSSVTNINYDTDTSTLTFDITGFSEYAIGPGLEIANRDSIANRVVEEPSITITGMVSDFNAEILITGNNNSKIVGVNEGTFIEEIELEEGVNTITIEATSVGGISEIITFDISYEPSTSIQVIIALLGLLIGGPLVAIGFGIYMRDKDIGSNQAENIS
jgi:hypothetical protein